MNQYKVLFKGPQRTVHAWLPAPDAIFAGMSGVRLARAIIEQDTLRVGDYSQWSVIVEGNGEERFEKAFPLE